MNETRWTTDTNSTTYKEALKIRYEVFVDEQKVPEDLEIDELEDQSHHLVLYENGTPIGTARIFQVGDGLYKMQRVAILENHRGQGNGGKLVEAIEHQVQHLDGKKITLGAQLHALSFYEKLGYEVEGPEFMDAGIPHREMTKMFL